MQAPLLAMTPAELLDAVRARGATPRRGHAAPRRRGADARRLRRQMSSTTGMPHVMVRRNLEKIRGVLANMREVLSGLTRGLDLRVLDDGMNTAGRAVVRAARPDARRDPAEQLARRARAVDAGDRAEDGARAEAGQRRALDALPHHPGVPGGGRAAPTRSAYFPAVTAARGEVLRRSGRGMLFGDLGAVGSGRTTRASSCTGPATARSCSAPTRPTDWERYLDVMVASVLENCGPLVRQRVRRLDDRARRRDRGGAGRAPGGGAAARRRGRGGRSSRPFADGRVAQRIRALDGRRPARAGRARRDGRAPRRAAPRRRATAAPTCCRRSCACDSRRARAREPRVPVPVRVASSRSGRERAAGACSARRSR